MPKSAAKTKKPLTKKKAPTKSRRVEAKAKPRARLSNVLELSKNCLLQLWRYRWLFLGIVIIYGAVNFVVAQGFSSGLNVSSLKNQFSGLFHGQFKELTSGLTIYALMLTSVGAGSGTGGGFGYELVLGVVGSLAIIWAIRNTTNNTAVRIRDAYYRGMYPLVPFLAVLLVIGLELLPMVAGISLYVSAINNNIAVNAIEKLGFGLLMLLFASLTMYLVSSSIFALYIATLPEMTPIKALRSANGLVKGRRWIVLTRLLYLPVALLIVTAAIMLPLIVFAAPAAPWVFMLLSLLVLLVIHSYLYNFYRELLE